MRHASMDSARTSLPPSAKLLRDENSRQKDETNRNEIFLDRGASLDEIEKQKIWSRPSYEPS